MFQGQCYLDTFSCFYIKTSFLIISVISVAKLSLNYSGDGQLQILDNFD